MMYAIEEYVAANGKSPFAVWYGGLKDKVAKAKLAARIDRAAHGNFGDWKSLSGAKGVFEMREHHGSGYRIFYGLVGGRVILLLAGSTKKDQNKMLAKATEYLADYQKRRKP